MQLKRRLLTLYRSFSASLLFMPVLMTLGALVLFAATSLLDQRLGGVSQPLPGPLGFLVFAGSASAARTLLGSIASSWATIAGVVYSVTLVTIQLSATKYSAQVIPTFERDRFNQVVLGAFTGTFAFSLLVLKTVRVSTEDTPAFVPAVGVNLATLMAIVSLFLFVAFVGNLTAYIRPTRFVDDLARKGEEGVAALRPGPSFSAVSDPALPARAATSRSEESRYLAGIGWRELEKALGKGPIPHTLEIAVPVGSRLERGDPVLRFSGRLRPEDEERLLGALRLVDIPGGEPDAFYVTETLADIALTAMSGGSTDTGVAQACAAGLARVAVADLEAGRLPPAWRWESGDRSVLLIVPPARPYEAALDALHRIVVKAGAEQYGAVADGCARALARIRKAAAKAEGPAAARIRAEANAWREALSGLANPWRETARTRLDEGAPA